MVGTRSTWVWISLAHLKDPPQALLGHLSTGLAAHLFNGWQAPECPVPCVQESTHNLSYPWPLPEPRKAPLALIPTNGDREKDVCASSFDKVPLS